MQQFLQKMDVDLIKTAYNHQASKYDEKWNKLKEKAKILENIVADSSCKWEKFEQLKNVAKALSRKVISLQKEIKDMKKNNESRSDIKVQSLSFLIKEK